jgi:hypothetical protein
MDAKLLLSLDMSTTCTGWSLHNIAEKTLLESGLIKPSTKGGVAKMKYPKQQLTKILDLTNQIKNLIESHKPSIIVIEEITGSKNRLGQKVLDACHGILWKVIEVELDKVAYYDVSGNQGWRYHLQLKLSDADKLANKEAKKLNKKLPASQRMPVVTPKHLACRHANARFGLELNCDLRETDGDLADSMCMADAFLTFRFAEIPK